MACRVRVLHSLVLGLIGMSLLTYSSYFAPSFLSFYSKDIGKIINTYEDSPKNSTPIFLLYNSSRPDSESQSVVVRAFESARLINASTNGTLRNRSSEILSPQNTSLLSESGNLEVNVQNVSHMNFSLIPKLSFKSTSLSSSSENSLVNNSSGIVDAIDRSFLTREIYESGYSHANIELCPDLGINLKLLIMITSAPAHIDARMAIRQTWGHFAQRNDVSIAFFLGSTNDSEIHKSIDNETSIYNDIIQAHFLDSYNNLTLKTVSLLEWVDIYCNRVTYVLKTDDDMFINVPALLNFLEKHMKDKRTIFGRLAKKWKPIRNKKSKYYVSLQQFSLAVFPDFTTGPAYLLTSDTVSELYKKALQRTYLKLEDVFVTGIVAQELKIKRIHVNEFLNKRISFNPCSIQRGISVHMVKYHEQFDLWKKLLDRRSKCK